MSYRGRSRNIEGISGVSCDIASVQNIVGMMYECFAGCSTSFRAYDAMWTLTWEIIVLLLQNIWVVRRVWTRREHLQTQSEPRQWRFLVQIIFWTREAKNPYCRCPRHNGSGTNFVWKAYFWMKVTRLLTFGRRKWRQNLAPVSCEHGPITDLPLAWRKV